MRAQLGSSSIGLVFCILQGYSHAVTGAWVMAAWILWNNARLIPPYHTVLRSSLYPGV
jgi:hypothetical protein